MLPISLEVETPPGSNRSGPAPRKWQFLTVSGGNSPSSPQVLQYRWSPWESWKFSQPASTTIRLCAPDDVISFHRDRRLFLESPSDQELSPCQPIALYFQTHKSTARWSGCRICSAEDCRLPLNLFLTDWLAIVWLSANTDAKLARDGNGNYANWACLTKTPTGAAIMRITVRIESFEIDSWLLYGATSNRVSLSSQNKSQKSTARKIYLEETNSKKAKMSFFS